MNDVLKTVGECIGELGNSDADEACQSLLNLVPTALPQLEEAFRVSRSRLVRLRLAQIVCHSRSVEALSFLRELLNNGDAEIWKTALDGLVYVAWDNATARAEVVTILEAARQSVTVDHRSWIDEALQQVRVAN